MQCDVDMVGVKSVMAEAEFMMMAVETYKMLGLDVYISYNNRKLLSGIIESVGIEPYSVSEVVLCIDKLEKIGSDGVESELLQLGLDKLEIDMLINYMKMQPDVLIENFNSKQKNNQIDQGIEELKELNSYIDSLGIENSQSLSQAGN